ncbi:patatin family protein [Aliidiomarina shirensis]|uniref:Patatin family protein n=1 Tax=Aliidiomarina shirensis TaxID=1048642 RepID=A0A432WNZ2_9GAMM|nr:patatin family protein [Aliidiomarina shirensis]RUO35520.1 patatin family protein [Aliidiomarina shirensis]
MQHKSFDAVNDSEHHTLVVEGGAMRGIFAAGVLDAFIAENFYPFDSAIGVSAGSTNLIGYLAGNHKRSYKVITDYARREEFMNIRRYLKGGHFCDVSWLWHTSFEEQPLNIPQFLERKIPLTVVTTSIVSGKACYYLVNETNMNDLFPASCAMPVVFREFPPIDEEPMTDGGLADSIPVIRAYEQGARIITVLLSQPLGFKKKPARFPNLLKPLFADHPALFAAVTARNDQYNRALDFIAKPPEDLQLNIIAPPSNFPVSRFTMDLDSLNMGYNQGINAGSRFIAESLVQHRVR